MLKDVPKFKEGVGMLLSELMRIKAEGDYDAIKALVEKYAVHFDPKLRDQVMARYDKLNIPTYWAGVNADLAAKFDPAGKTIVGNILVKTDDPDQSQITIPVYIIVS